MAGGGWTGRPAYFSFLRQVCGLELPGELHLEWAGPGGVPRLHHPDGPAIRWRDGWAVHALHGTRVPGPVA
jgi:hypothetical protein